MRNLSRQEHGFTLTEIMVVVGIVGLLTALAVSTLQGVLLRQQKSAAAQEIQALLNQARSMARSTALPATVTLAQVATPPGGSIVAAIGAPTNWTRTLTLGAGSNYNAVGLVGGALGPFTFSPRGTVTPGAFTMNIQDRNGQTVTVSVGLLGDITITQ